MIHRWFVSLSLVLVSLLATTGVAQDYDALREYHHVELNELNREPHTYKNTEVKFKIYFHKIDDMWSPFFAPFSEGEYINFAGWSAKKHLWKKEQMVQDFPFLYVRNEAGAVDELLSADKYDLLQVKGTVKSAFKSYPWIEVRHIDVIRSDAYTEKQLRYLMLGGEAHQNDQPTEATRYFEKGLQSNRLTRYDRAEILKHLAINYYDAQDFRNALRAVERYERVTDKRDDLLHKIRKRSRELLRMSPEERNAELQQNKDEMETDSDSSQSGLLPGSQNGLDQHASRMQKKYETLISRHRELLREHQSLKEKHASVKKTKADLAERVSRATDKVTALKQEKTKLKRRLSEVYQKNARLLAKLRKTDDRRATDRKRVSNASSGSTNASSNDHDVDGSNSADNRFQAERNPEREKLLSRIRLLKRRTQSLRSRVRTLSAQKRKARREVDRLNDQVRLETSAASDTSSKSLQDQGS
jgi:hypothetical protein